MIKTKTIAASTPQELDKLLLDFLQKIDDKTPRFYYGTALAFPNQQPQEGGVIRVGGEQLQQVNLQAATIFSVLVAYQAKEEPQLTQENGEEKREQG